MNRSIYRFVFLLPLGLFLAGPAYGDASVTGEAGFSNIGGANGGEARPYISYTADAGAHTQVGPGTAGVALELQFVIDLQEASSNGNNLGDNFLSAYYAQEIGPGELAVYLKQSTAFSYWNLEPSVEYSGVVLDFADLGFGLWYNHKFSRKISVAATTAENGAGNNGSLLSLRHPHGDGFDSESGGDSGGGSEGSSGGAVMSSYYGGGGPYSDKAGFYILAAFDFGLNIQYGFSCGFNRTGSGGSGVEAANIVYLDLNYQINDRFRAGLEIDDTGKDFSGFTLKPYGIFHATEHIDLGFNLYFRKINSASDSLETGPAVWVMYTF